MAKHSPHTGHPKLWGGILLVATLPVLAILGTLASSFFAPSDDAWRHVLDHRLGEICVNSALLVLCVALLSGVIGTGLAWLVTAYEFPGQRSFRWMLLLPLGIPGYVLGFVFIGIFDQTGGFSRWLFESFGLRPPPIRNLGGLSLVMSLGLYPYVYLMARNAFSTQGLHLMEAAKSLGHSEKAAFVRAALPAATPWIGGALLLVCMETLADFGTVAVFNFDVFTTAIYKSWFALFSINTAMKLAALLLLPALALAWLERRSHRWQDQQSSSKTLSPRRLQGSAAWLAFLSCFLVLSLALLLPVLQLLVWIFETRAEGWLRFLGSLQNSLIIASACAALITTAGSLVAASGWRLRQWLPQSLATFANLGYALPGALLAVGIHSLVVKIVGSESMSGLGTGLLVMVLALSVRFLAVAHNPMRSQFQRITGSMQDAARGLGVTGLQQIWRVHLPILKPGLATAAILVFVDVIKEMPITLMTRPFGWNTLSVQIFELTSEGEWQRAALPALGILIAGLLPALLLTGTRDKPVQRLEQPV